MKRLHYLLLVLTALSFTVACKEVSFKKTKSGLLYKIYPGNGKDSLIKDGQIVKFQYTLKYDDSLMDRYNSYGKLPGYVKAQAQPTPSYDFQELLLMLRKGDSAVTVQMADTLLARPSQQSQLLPPNAKKGGRLTMTIKIAEVFAEDSLAMADYNAESEKDRPRQIKEQEEQMAKMQKDMEEQQLREVDSVIKSGYGAKQIKEVEDYLAARNINAQKTGKGTFVSIAQQGTGPQAELGKYLKVKYTGKILKTDSTFEANVIPSLQLGKDPVIAGWVEGLQLFKQGGKGSIYIPGFLAYGSRPGPGSQLFEALLFDVEVQEVSDKPIPQLATEQ